MTGALTCNWRPRTRELFRDIVIINARHRNEERKRTLPDAYRELGLETNPRAAQIHLILGNSRQRTLARSIERLEDAAEDGFLGSRGFRVACFELLVPSACELGAPPALPQQSHASMEIQQNFTIESHRLNLPPKA